MSREQLKSLALVMLFGICVILVSRVWSGSSFQSTQTAREDLTDTHSKDILKTVFCPKTTVVNFGADSHTAMFSDRYSIWSAVQTGLLRFLSEKTIETEMTSDQWVEKNHFRSVRFDLPVEVATSDLFKILGGEDGRYSGHDRMVTSILVSASEPGTLYLSDGPQKQYFSLNNPNVKTDISGILSTIENSEEPEYESITDHYDPHGEAAQKGTINLTMIPRIGIHSIPVLKAEPEKVGRNVGNSSEAVQKMAVAAFGNQPDFINRLIDVNGAIVFLYGYGEKAFRIYTDGHMDFQAKPDSAMTTDKVGFAEAFQQAVGFVSQVGDSPSNLCLSGYQKTQNSDNTVVQHFEFSYIEQGYPVVNAILNSKSSLEIEEPVITVDLQGSEIIKFSRRMSIAKSQGDGDGLWDQPMNLDDVIAKNENYDKILKCYMQASGDNAQFDPSIQHRLLNSIQSVRIVYCHWGDRFIPAWEANFGGARLCFNIYDGKILAADR